VFDPAPVETCVLAPAPKGKTSAGAVRAVRAISFTLEDDLASKLEPATPDAVGGDVAGKSVAPVRVELQISELTADGVVDIDVGNPQPLVIEKIERFGLELERNPLADSGVLEDSHVYGANGLTALRVATERRVWSTEDMFGLDSVNDEMSRGDRSNWALACGASATDAAGVYADQSSNGKDGAPGCRAGAGCRIAVAVLAH